MAEEFKVDDIGQKLRDAYEEGKLNACFLMAAADEIRRNHGAYLWVFPIKWRDDNHNTYKESFGWEIEYENGKCVSYGYCGEPEIEDYLEAYKKVIEHFNISLKK